MPTSIILKANDVVIPAMLNDTVAAQEVKKRLPFKVTGYRSAVDYCCAATCGIFDPTETQFGWQNGDISFSGGWFTILFDGEGTAQNNHGMMIIAHIEDEHLPLVQGLPDTVRFVVELANLNEENQSEVLH
jgi:hypothetical protein